ncbi:M20/M25/M40 family metallo-hydrolase [Aliiglaciecola sp. CAU 1673]|uniref:M20/M25/M40 family metallo-hydrolase n=1 Tax=Aliiglaciecola sp. CAU 1673 TaxID=3032595 RepID=UPI0023DC1D90|nr:M20/M25/M40 family metallo-hydrolase [Aliiglaciecola sp. CAU 1673]MDF2176928.1 M20/M25/M40 family metallo-hydrolase [Aliiglaciecola sp. CAU 1673]
MKNQFSALATSSLKSLFVGALLLSTPLQALPENSPQAQKALEIYRNIIAIPTVEGRGKVPEMVNYLVGELKAAGFADQAIHILPKHDSAALVVRYAGDGSSGKAPILLLAHMDVVEALDKDWQRPPFELTEDDRFFYGRGTLDNKLGVTMLVSTFIRLKQEGFVPHRDLVIVFSGDEETDMHTTKMLANDYAQLTQAEFALNTDAGGGDLDSQGNALVYQIQAAEKTYASFELSVTNPGGHSSRPRADNAIYELMAALQNIQQYQFPVQDSKMIRDYLRLSGEKLGGELGAAMLAFADNPFDEKAAQRLAQEPSYVGMTRTTCVPTLLSGGHAENALPQSASTTINCRIFPGTPVAEVKKTLEQQVNNPAVNFKVLGEPVESPISELREDVLAAVSKAIHSRYPGVPLTGIMEAGATDGMYFRARGIPTFGIASAFMNPDDVYAHGLNERLPKATFYGGLDHWMIILKELAGKQ